MRKKHSRLILLLLIFALVFSTFPFNVESQTWENQYGKLEVYPDISYELITQKQFYNVTWFYPDNDLDIAFRFNESLSYGGVYFFNGTSYNKVSHNHIEYNSKHYYVVSDIHFVQNEIKHGYWEYNTPINSSGKWDMFVKLSSDTWQYAFNNDRYIQLDPWWNSAYGYMKQITINHSYIDSDLVNFPVLVTSSNTTMLSKMDDGDSLRFTNIANTTEYNFEIEYFDDADKMVIWVNVTDIYSTSNTIFNMYYNNSGASDGQNIADTWNSGYAMVLHMNSTISMKDSTNNNNDISGSGGDPTNIDGLIGSCVDFDGNDYLMIDDANSLSMSGLTDCTFSYWLKNNGTTSDFSPIVKHNAVGWTNDYYLHHRYGNNDIQATFYDNIDGYARGTSDAICLSNTWGMTTVTFTDSQNGVEMYCNTTALSIADSGSAYDPGGNADDDLDIGGHVVWDTYLTGYMDEVRISNVIRNTSWIKADFHSQNQTTDFLTFSDAYNVPTYSTFSLSNVSPVGNREILCLNLSQLCVDVNFSCGSGDYINITLVHDGNITYLNDTTNIVNDTYCLNLSGINLTAGSYYIWWINISSSCADEVVTTNSRYNFTCEIGCDCYDELLVINYKLYMIQQTLDDGVGVGGISGAGNVLGMVGLFGLFGFIGYLSGKKRNDDL